jgi:TPR repeat protein
VSVALCVVVIAGLMLRPKANDELERGRRAQAANNFGEAAQAWRVACFDEKIGEACALFAALVAKNREVSSTSQENVDALRTGCRLARHAESCVRLGLLREYDANDVDEANRSYRSACELGAPLGCFHFEVQAASTADVGRIDVTEEQRAAAQAACDGGERETCYALALIADRNLAVGADRTFVDDEMTRLCKNKFVPACDYRRRQELRERDVVIDTNVIAWARRIRECARARGATEGFASLTLRASSTGTISDWTIDGEHGLSALNACANEVLKALPADTRIERDRSTTL